MLFGTQSSSNWILRSVILSRLVLKRMANGAAAWPSTGSSPNQARWLVCLATGQPAHSLNIYPPYCALIQYISSLLCTYSIYILLIVHSFNIYPPYCALILYFCLFSPSSSFSFSLTFFITLPLMFLRSMQNTWLMSRNVAQG